MRSPRFQGKEYRAVRNALDDESKKATSLGRPPTSVPSAARDFAKPSSARA